MTRLEEAKPRGQHLALPFLCVAADRGWFLPPSLPPFPRGGFSPCPLDNSLLWDRLRETIRQQAGAISLISRGQQSSVPRGRRAPPAQVRGKLPVCPGGGGSVSSSHRTRLAGAGRGNGAGLDSAGAGHVGREAAPLKGHSWAPQCTAWRVTRSGGSRLGRSSLSVEMSLILSASVIRVRDGLPLSASTDYEQSTGMQECRKYFKMLSRKLAQLPDRCTLKTGHYNINFISSLGVSYMMLCTENYPNVLAFSFLDELQKEFITTYNMMKTNTAVRPYCFIEFDNFIQRTKQRYNSPRSLSTKINLSDMQTEIKLRPPYQISMCELGSANGVTSAFSVDCKGAGKISSAHQRLEPATLSGIVAFILSLLCGALNLIRGFHAIESLLQSDGEDFNYIIAFFLGTAACLYQCYLLVYYTSWRNVKSFLTFGLICLCNMYLYELRNLWQLFFHVTVGAFVTLQIWLRQAQGKAPDYDV
uniref:Vesicle-trafficking protein SEC22a n=2 Tax=Oryctolagus cuniculus TaxID=9986 RepID=A0A5F9DRV6_RABIT